MFMVVRVTILAVMMGLLAFPVIAAEATKEQLKSLDEQVQDIKADALKTGANLLLLEEKLLYPSSTQVALYVSLERGATYRLDTIEIELDGKRAAQHLYTTREHEALQKGGMQRIYTSNIKTGEHELKVVLGGKALAGPSFRRTERFKFRKDAGPKVLEVHLVASGDHLITLRDW